MDLPDWIEHDSDKGYYTTLKPCICSKCRKIWYPRINKDGTLKLKICPKCKTKIFVLGG